MVWINKIQKRFAQVQASVYVDCMNKLLYIPGSLEFLKKQTKPNSVWFHRQKVQSRINYFFTYISDISKKVHYFSWFHRQKLLTQFDHFLLVKKVHYFSLGVVFYFISLFYNRRNFFNYRRTDQTGIFATVAREASASWHLGLEPIGKILSLW